MQTFLQFEMNDRAAATRKFFVSGRFHFLGGWLGGVMKSEIIWNQIRLAWQRRHVSTRQFCREIGIDRSWIQEKIRDEGWKTGPHLTIEEMERKIVTLRARGELLQANELQTEIRYRIREWDFVARLVRMMLYWVRGDRRSIGR